MDNFQLVRQEIQELHAMSIIIETLQKTDYLPRGAAKLCDEIFTSMLENIKKQLEDIESFYPGIGPSAR